MALLPSSDRALAHLGLRWVLGLNITLHGAVRLPNLAGFVAAVKPGFEGTWLPTAVAGAYLWVLPFLELAVGLALIAGFRLRWTLFAGMMLMGTLTAGTCLKQDWSNAGIQLLYTLVYWVLLRYSADAEPDSKQAAG